MRRFGQVIDIKADRLDEYKTYHAAVWPGVLRAIKQSNIQNYSIYLRGCTLFAYFEYTGDDFEEDMKRMAADQTTQDWWKIMEDIQIPRPDRQPGEWWANMEEVFHLD
mmetsp:Transcript_1742/g.3973  ORF Transcript_1742/g.3973 Transcript_1742/m.3973 type:complete len:108 (-) Transcript_1742:3-326(-)